MTIDEHTSTPDAVASAPVMAVHDLHKAFRLGGRGLSMRKPAVLRAVDGIDLSIGASETVGLIGESGSGKSTLGRVMLRLLGSDKGSIEFGGRDITDLGGSAMRALRSEMNLVFQNPHAAVDRRFRIDQIVGEPLRTHGSATGAELTKRVNELLDVVALPRTMRDRYPHELSGGQLQRVVIARAVATRPKFLVADEPTAALDMSVRAQVINLLEDLKEVFDLSMLFISHDLRTVSHVSNRIAVMYLGRIVEQGPAAEVETVPLHPYTTSLIAALPRLEAGGKPRTVVDGELPSALSMPTGCRYAARCPLATEICRTEYPVLELKRPGRWVSCHHVPAELDSVPTTTTSLEIS